MRLGSDVGGRETAQRLVWGMWHTENGIGSSTKADCLRDHVEKRNFLGQKKNMKQPQVQEKNGWEYELDNRNILYKKRGSVAWLGLLCPEPAYEKFPNQNDHSMYRNPVSHRWVRGLKKMSVPNKR